MSKHQFSVTETFPDGRVLLLAYSHIDHQIIVNMVVYADATLTDGRRYLSLNLIDDQPLDDQISSLLEVDKDTITICVYGKQYKLTLDDLTEANDEV